LEKILDTRETIFDVRNIHYSYDQHLSALNQISLTVHAGEKLAILGSNGCGKSTLLKLLDGLYFATSGEIIAFGKSLTENAFFDDQFNFDFRHRVGFVFQDSDAQLFMPSVWEEVTFAPLQLGFTPEEIKKRAEWALESLKIEKIRDRAPHQLSGGEKKRVALASVLSLMPDVWLLDEPTAGLDPRSVSWVIDFFNNQASLGKTVVIATHDLEMVKLCADRVYVLDEDHQLLSEGAPQKILSDDALLIRSNLKSASI
jgi:cobalt/nickel transport system ATP-binding protein